MSEVVSRMRARDLRIRVIAGGNDPGVTPVTVAYMGNDRYTAQAVVRMLVTRLMEQSVLVRSQPGSELEVLDPASLAEQPAEPNRMAIVIIGLGVGLAGGVVVSGRRRVKAMAAGAL